MTGRRCTDNKHNTDCRSEADSLSVIRSSRRVQDGTDSVGVITFTSTEMQEQVQALSHIDLDLSKFPIEMLQGL
jgi:hypothetical protein